MVPLPLNIPTPTPVPDRGGPVACLGGPDALYIGGAAESVSSASATPGVPKLLFLVVVPYPANIEFMRHHYEYVFYAIDFKGEPEPSIRNRNPITFQALDFVKGKARLKCGWLSGFWCGGTVVSQLSLCASPYDCS